MPVRAARRKLHWAGEKNSTHVLEPELIFAHCCCRAYSVARYLAYIHRNAQPVSFLCARSGFSTRTAPKIRSTRSPLILRRNQKSDYCFLCERQDALSAFSLCWSSPSNHARARGYNFVRRFIAPLRTLFAEAIIFAETNICQLFASLPTNPWVLAIIISFAQAKHNGALINRPAC
jgi:hypothetical protein